MPKTATEVSFTTAIVALTAFVAVCPCPLQTLSFAMVALFVAAILGCWYLDMMNLAVAVSLAFVALALRIKGGSGRRLTQTADLERFTLHAIERSDGADRAGSYGSPPSLTRPPPDAQNVEDSSAYQKVYETMTKEDLELFITPAHLESAQSNTLPSE